MTGMDRLSGPAEQDPNKLNVERIRSLPHEILSYILGKLSIVDAVKTNVLSTYWRDKWLSSPQFSFDANAIARTLNQKDLKWDVVANVVSKYVRHQATSIKLFSLTADCSGHYPDMYQWIRSLSEKDVVELFIKNTGSSNFKMPSYLFSCAKLKSLTLICCELRVPSTFKRFNLLDKIQLDDVSICDSDLEHLILSCPLLKTLTLLSISGLKHLRINAPMLTWLHVDTRFLDIVIGAAPCLSVFIMVDSYIDPEDRPVLDRHSVIRCLSSMKSIDNLALSGKFIKDIAADYGHGDFLLQNQIVSSVFLYGLRFENTEVFGVCLSLLTFCPNIRHFRFSFEAAKGPKMASNFFVGNTGKFTFPRLRWLTVTCPSDNGMGCVVNFIEFLMSHSPNLKSVAIQKEGKITMNTRRVQNMISRFRKRCPTASVYYEQDGKVVDL